MSPGAASAQMSHWAAFSVGFPSASADMAVAGTGSGHLALEASPHPVGAAQILCHGGFADLRAAGTARIWAVNARWYVVHGGECFFLGHLALVWTSGGHTYAVGFHDWTSDSRRFGLAVARTLVRVPPA
jgi:hypothetical protein